MYWSGYFQNGNNHLALIKNHQESVSYKKAFVKEDEFSINQNHQESVSIGWPRTYNRLFSINQNHQESVSE